MLDDIYKATALLDRGNPMKVKKSAPIILFPKGLVARLTITLGDPYQVVRVMGRTGHISITAVELTRERKDSAAHHLVGAHILKGYSTNERR